MTDSCRDRSQVWPGASYNHCQATNKGLFGILVMPTTDGQLGFCIVGCGMIARFHVRALEEVPGAKVTAYVSRSKASADKLIADTLTPVPVFTDLSEALKRPDVDVVIITTPSGAHQEPAVAAASA